LNRICENVENAKKRCANSNLACSMVVLHVNRGHRDPFPLPPNKDFKNNEEVMFKVA
jgi:hypothetical protein